MKKAVLSPIAMAVMLAACQPDSTSNTNTDQQKITQQETAQQTNDIVNTNPLLTQSSAPFGVPDFSMASMVFSNVGVSVELAISSICCLFFAMANSNAGS